ncbi:MAG: Biotin carboxylase [Candidatus Methanomarinus sp.]|nr:MAG: Biotin carboxylase [ANME-2 cluster archaeon]
MKKTIMFIGAGKYQLPGIEKAKEIGLKVIAIDRDLDAPGFKVADVPVVLDVTDIEGAIKIAKENDIDGILTVASDIAVPTVAAVAEELGLPGISPEVAKIATNKALMREKFIEHGVPSPKFRKVRTLDEAREAVEKIGASVVIKPVDNAGSRGVSKIDKIDGLIDAFYHAQKHSRVDDVIVEEFIGGIECTIEGMTYKYKTEILAISEKKKPDGQYRVATDLTYPPSFTEEVIKDIKNVVELAIEAVGIDMGATHSEVMVTPHWKPILIEVAARGGGFKVFSDVIPFVSGVDAVLENIKMCIGRKPDIKPKYEKCVVLRFFTPNQGMLNEIIGFEEAKLVKNTDVGLFKKVGDIIPPLATDGDRTGYILAWGDTRNDAIKSADTVENIVKFVIKR